MFQMKFQSTADYSTSGDEEDERTVREDSKVRRSPEPAPKVVFEGKVGKFGKSRALPGSDNTIPHFADGHSSLRSMIMSPSAQVAPAPSSEPKRAGIDLVDLEAPAQEFTDSSPQKATIGLDAGSLPVNGSKIEKTAIMGGLHYQDFIRGQDLKVVSVEVHRAFGETRADSGTRESSEYSAPTHRNEEEDEAMTEMINKLMQVKKDMLQKNNDKSAKPWEEPLLAAHDQEELDIMAKEEAKIEAKRLAEEERLEREAKLRELRDLANCTTGSAPSLGKSPAFKKSKQKKLGKSGENGFYRFLKTPFRIFRSRKKYAEFSDARAAEVVVPKASLFGGARTVPSSGTTDSQLATMRNSPQLRMTRQPQMQFATVESTQRDVPAWTREEYLRKNGRILPNSTYKPEEEEFGGIEGNNTLLNQYYDDGILTDYDSDSD